jgi:hypothetical protein
MMHFEYKKKIRVVTMAVLREVAIKEVPEVDIDVVMDKDMGEWEAGPHLFKLWKNWPCVKVFYQTTCSLWVLLHPQARQPGLSRLIEEVGRK